MIKLIAYSSIFLLTFVIAGGAAALAWMWLDADRRKKLVGERQPDLLRREVVSTLSLLTLLIGKAKFAPRLKRMLDEADVEWSVGRATLTILVSATFTLALLMRFDWVPWWAALACACAAGYAPISYLHSKREKRLREVEEQLPEALDYISRALVAGHSLPMAMELLADEVGPPMAAELRMAVDEYNLGLSMSNALKNLALRLPTVDIQFFVSAILTQSRSGGSLHELLDNLAETIRERGTLKRQVRALSANGRLTAIVLCMMPFIVAGVMMMVNQEYFMILAGNPGGRTLMFLALCGQITAYFVIRRIVDIKV